MSAGIHRQHRKADSPSMLPSRQLVGNQFTTSANQRSVDGILRLVKKGTRKQRDERWEQKKDGPLQSNSFPSVHKYRICRLGRAIFSCVKFIVDTLLVDRDSEARATKSENKEAYAESERYGIIRPFTMNF